jgi:hypothetical protein
MGKKKKNLSHKRNLWNFMERNVKDQQTEWNAYLMVQIHNTNRNLPQIGSQTLQNQEIKQTLPFYHLLLKSGVFVYSLLNNMYRESVDLVSISKWVCMFNVSWMNNLKNQNTDKKYAIYFKDLRQRMWRQYCTCMHKPMYSLYTNWFTSSTLELCWYIREKTIYNNMFYVAPVMKESHNTCTRMEIKTKQCDTEYDSNRKNYIMSSNKLLFHHPL